MANTVLSIPPGLADIGNQLSSTGTDLSTSVLNVIKDLRQELQNADNYPNLIEENLAPFLGHLIDDFTFFHDRWNDLGAMLVEVATTMEDLDAQQLSQIFNDDNWQGLKGAS